MGLGHGREQMLRHRINPSFDAPLNRQLFLHDTVADRLDPLRLEQEMIIDEIHGAVAVLFEILEFGHHMLRAACPPFAFVEDRNVAKHTGPWAAA